MLDNVTWQQLDISLGRRGKSGRGVWGFGTVLRDIIAACIDTNSVRGSTIEHSSSIWAADSAEVMAAAQKLGWNLDASYRLLA